MYANKLNVNNKQQVSREPSRASLVQQQSDRIISQSHHVTVIQNHSLGSSTFCHCTPNGLARLRSNTPLERDRHVNAEHACRVVMSFAEQSFRQNVRGL